MLGVSYQRKFCRAWPRGDRPCLAQLTAVALVGDVGETDDASPPDAEHVGQDARDVQDGLQGLRKDDEIELSVGKGGQALVEVGLDHIQPAADAGQHRLFVEFDAHQAARPRSRSRASSPPVPQPRSSTLEPGGIRSRIVL